MRRLAVMTACLLALTACGDSKPHGPCVQTERYYQPPIYVMVGKVMVPVGGYWTTHCVKYAPATTGAKP